MSHIFDLILGTKTFKKSNSQNSLTKNTLVIKKSKNNYNIYSDIKQIYGKINEKYDNNNTIKNDTYENYLIMFLIWILLCIFYDFLIFFGIQISSKLYYFVIKFIIVSYNFSKLK